MKEKPAPPPTVIADDDEQWRVVDEGWGRRAVDFATLTEPSSAREYVAMHHHLAVSEGDRLLDVACGSGLAIELAGLRGATCAGIDASPRLLAVAKDRNPQADLRVGDMNALPWATGSFDVVTSFRGIWGTTPGALSEVLRVLVPGGRVGLTVWGHIKASPGAWAMAPFTLATEPKVQNQAAMVALGRPGTGEALLSTLGFSDIERVEVPFVFEFADPEVYARGLASTGPAYEAIQAVGDEAFRHQAVELGRERLRAGLPLRAPVALVGYVATKPAVPLASRAPHEAVPTSPRPIGFLGAAPDTPEAQRLFDDDLDGVGFVTNVSRLWAHGPELLRGLADLMGESTAAASAFGDSYCALAWGKRLADSKNPEIAAGVIAGGAEGLDVIERALARWARLIAGDPNAIVSDDVQALRDAGLDDQQIFAVTAYVALRLAFSTVNDALGAGPDERLGATAPDVVRGAVGFGRPAGGDG